MEHTASTLTTLKAENLTWGETTHANTNKIDKHRTGLFFFVGSIRFKLEMK